MTKDRDDQLVDERLQRLASATRALSPPPALTERLIAMASADAAARAQAIRSNRALLVAFSLAAAAAFAIAHFEASDLRESTVTQLDVLDPLE